MPNKDRILTQSEIFVMLAVQRRARDAYGITIRDEIANETGHRMTFGVLYTVLARLENEGFLSSRDGEATAERGGRAKRYFSITGLGQKVLRSNLAALDRLRGAAAVLSFAGGSL